MTDSPLGNEDLIVNSFYKLHYGTHLNPYHDVERNGPIRQQKKKTGKAPKFPRCVPEKVYKPPTRPVGSPEMYERMLSKSFRDVKKPSSPDGVVKWPDGSLRPLAPVAKDEYGALSPGGKNNKTGGKTKKKSIYDNFSFDFTEEEKVLKLRAALLIISVENPRYKTKVPKHRRPRTVQNESMHSQKLLDKKNQDQDRQFDDGDIPDESESEFDQNQNKKQTSDKGPKKQGQGQGGFIPEIPSRPKTTDDARSKSTGDGNNNRNIGNRMPVAVAKASSVPNSNSADQSINEDYGAEDEFEKEEEVEEVNNNKPSMHPGSIRPTPSAGGALGAEKGGRPNPFGGGGPAGAMPGGLLGALQGGLGGLKKTTKKEPTAREIKEKQEKDAQDKEQDTQNRKDEMQNFHDILEEYIPNSRQFSSLNAVVENDWNDVLGSGKFATVYKAKSKLSNERIKGTGTIVLKIAEFYGNNPQSSGQMRLKDQEEARKFPPAKITQEYAREVKCLALLQHPNIVRLEGVLVPPAPLGLVIEHMSGGSLGQALKDVRWTPTLISQKQRMGILTDVLQGLAFMHKKGYVHRDVKPYNILLCPSTTHSGAPVSPRSRSPRGGSSSNGSNSLELDGPSHWVSAKIADFGTAVTLKAGETLQDEVGTSGYTAPEVFMGAYDARVDIFSFAVVMWSLFTSDQTNPMSGKSDDIIRSGSIRPVLSQEHPSAVAVVCKKGWASEPSSRPSLASICNLLDIKDSSLESMQ